MKLAKIEIKVNANVTKGVGVGNIANDCSCTKPPVITADFVVLSQPNCLRATDAILSMPIYNAQTLAAQYACTRPLLNGNNRDST